jgi:hypothetical protein
MNAKTSAVPAANAERLAPGSTAVVGIPDALLPDVRDHLFRFVGQAPDAGVFVGPRVLRSGGSTFRGIGTRRVVRLIFRASISTICGTWGTLAA